MLSINCTVMFLPYAFKHISQIGCPKFFLATMTKTRTKKKYLTGNYIVTTKYTNSVTATRRIYPVSAPVTKRRKTSAGKLFVFMYFLPARRYASAGYRDRNVSVCLSVCPSVCPSRAGIVSKRRKVASLFFQHLVAP